MTAMDSWTAMMKDTDRAVERLDLVFQKLLALADRIRKGQDADGALLRQTEILLNSTLPTTDVEKLLVFFINYLASIRRAELTPYCFKIHRACFLLLVDGAAIVTALNLPASVEITTGPDGKYRVANAATQARPGFAIPERPIAAPKPVEPRPVAPKTILRREPEHYIERKEPPKKDEEAFEPVKRRGGRGRARDRERAREQELERERRVERPAKSSTTGKPVMTFGQCDKLITKITETAKQDTNQEPQSSPENAAAEAAIPELKPTPAATQETMQNLTASYLNALTSTPAPKKHVSNWAEAEEDGPDWGASISPAALKKTLDAIPQKPAAKKEGQNASR